VATSTWIILGTIAALLALATFVLVRGWRGDVSLKAMTKNGLVSLAGGLELFGVSASMAAILGGPGVVSVQWRSRVLYKRSIARVTPDALFEFVDALLEQPKKNEKKKLPHWLIERTDVGELPELGLRILLDLRDPELSGVLTCGFADPVLPERRPHGSIRSRACSRRSVGSIPTSIGRGRRSSTATSNSRSVSSSRGSCASSFASSGTMSI